MAAMNLQKNDQLLQIGIGGGLILRELIKVIVNKFIAHYDEPLVKDKKVNDYCISIFSVGGRLPLIKFLSLHNRYIISLIVQMWYDAGGLGVSMSERNSKDRKSIIDFGNAFLS